MAQVINFIVIDVYKLVYACVVSSVFLHFVRMGRDGQILWLIVFLQDNTRGRVQAGWPCRKRMSAGRSTDLFT